jgi:hypothetical protein
MVEGALVTGAGILAAQLQSVTSQGNSKTIKANRPDKNIRMK